MSISISARAAETKCQHSNHRHDSGWEYVTCHGCRWIGTGITDWGIAKRMWFKTPSDAAFYKIHGRVPDGSPQPEKM
jgi:hypothetical protein